MNEGKSFDIFGAVGKFKSLKMKLILCGIGFVAMILLLVIMYFFFDFESSSGGGKSDYGPYSSLEPGKGICGLTIPLKVHYSISSLYGYRVPRAQNGSSFHRGIDLAVSSGTDVYAATSGVVTVGNGPLTGHYLRIKNANGEVVKYYHLSKTLVSSGKTVNQGDLVAKSGNTGASSGPHLHFEFADASGKTVSLNNLFGYTDLPECINYVGAKSESERRKCNKNDSRKMNELAKTQFKNACAGTPMPNENNNTEEEKQNEEEVIDENEVLEETQAEETQTEQTNLLGTE